MNLVINGKPEAAPDSVSVTDSRTLSGPQVEATGYYALNADPLIPHEIATALANELGVPVRYVVDQVVTDVVNPA